MTSRGVQPQDPAQDQSLHKPLLEASSEGKTSESQRILASSGDIVNCVDGHKGKTALMYAVHEGHADTAREHGASLEAFDIGRGYTVLMWASVRGHSDMG